MIEHTCAITINHTGTNITDGIMSHGMYYESTYTVWRKCLTVQNFDELSSQGF